MKQRIYIIVGVFLFTSCIFNMQSQEISLENAKDIAIKWHQFVKNGNAKKEANEKEKGKSSPKIKDVKQKKEKEEESPSFYAVNFDEGGYVIVSSDESVGPVLGYGKNSTYDETKISKEELIWWSGVSSHIQNKKSKKNTLKSTSALNIDDMIINLSTQSASANNVPSLFETYQTSRWAGWGVYASEFPGGNSYGQGCVPLAMAQIMKYYKYPIQGSGSRNGMDFSRQRYNYNMMPFRLTYCGNPSLGGICDDGSFDIIPGVTADHIREVSRLIYHCALSVDWGPEGTFGNPGDWASMMVTYFGYSPGFTFKDDSYISNNNEAFKASLLNELINKRPILLGYYYTRANGNVGGHAVVIDGVENNNYFHFAVGRGGSEDAYYYLFDQDNDGIHTTPTGINIFYYHAAFGIQPNCPQSNINLNNVTISSSENKTYLSNDLININNVTIKNGGRVTFQAANEVIFGNNFEAEQGSDVYITVGRCGPP